MWSACVFPVRWPRTCALLPSGVGSTDVMSVHTVHDVVWFFRVLGDSLRVPWFAQRAPESPTMTRNLSVCPFTSTTHFCFMYFEVLC